MNGSCVFERVMGYETDSDRSALGCGFPGADRLRKRSGNGRRFGGGRAFSGLLDAGGVSGRGGSSFGGDWDRHGFRHGFFGELYRYDLGD